MKRISFFMMTAVALAGCQESMENIVLSEKTQTFEAITEGFEGNTKTSIDNQKNIVWSENDLLAIFQGCSIADKYQVTAETAGTGNGAFELIADNSGDVNDDFNSGVEIAANIALYPYAEGLAVSNTNVMDGNDVEAYEITGFVLPEIQHYASDSFGEGAFPMVAVTETMTDHTLKFKNLMGAIKLQLKGNQIVKSITITGKNNEILSGAVTLTAYANGLAPAITMTANDDASKSVTLDCGDGVQLSKSTATNFIIALPPVLFSLGFEVIVTDSENKEKVIQTNVANTVLRSSILSMPAVILSDETIVNYVDEYGVNHGKGIAIGGIVWAPVNCGYKAPTYDDGNIIDKGYPYGKLYQWGRKYGQGYSAYYDSEPLTYPAPVSAMVGNGVSMADNFFKDHYDWLETQNDKLWNSGTEKAPVKTDSDPCPEGWRVPTFSELNALRSGYSEWTSKDNQKGYYFSGVSTTNHDAHPLGEDKPQVFFPAAGYRGGSGHSGDRGDDGYYWSSEPDFSEAKYLFIDYGNVYVSTSARANGYSVRCVQE